MFLFFLSPKEVHDKLMNSTDILKSESKEAKIIVRLRGSLKGTVTGILLLKFCLVSSKEALLKLARTDYLGLM